MSMRQILNPGLKNSLSMYAKHGTWRRRETKFWSRSTSFKRLLMLIWGGTFEMMIFMKIFWWSCSSRMCYTSSLHLNEKKSEFHREVNVKMRCKVFIPDGCIVNSVSSYSHVNDVCFPVTNNFMSDILSR